MKKLVFLTALFLMIFVGTTAHAKTCEEKLTNALDKGRIDSLDSCKHMGMKMCGPTSSEDITAICVSLGLTRVQTWRDVDRVAIEQRVLKQIRVRAETSKVRNNRTYH